MGLRHIMDIFKYKIFGIGLSRTGTTTLTNILNKVGYNIVHYPSNKIQIFSNANDGCTDIPVILHYKELYKFFPDVKFIYTVRNKEEWLDSIVPYFERKRSWKGMIGSPQEQLRTKIYSQPFPNRQQASDAWDKHHKDVMEFFSDKQDKLLILDIVGGDDTDKLWKFLDMNNNNLPKEFPHDNKMGLGK